MAALIFQEFTKLIEVNQKEMSLGEIVDFAKQLEEAGYIFSISRGINGEVNLNVERPRLICSDQASAAFSFCFSTPL